MRLRWPSQENVAQSITTRPLAEGTIWRASLRCTCAGSTSPASRAPTTRDLLQRTLIDDPWADEAIPSLVSAAPDGTIVGFIGSSVRHVRLDGEPLRAAYASHLVADPDFPNRTIGLFLLRAFLRGPQDLTLTDTATVQARRALGRARQRASPPPRDRMAAASAADRRRVRHRRSRGGRLALAARALNPVARLLDHGTGRIAGEARSARAESVGEDELTPETVLEHLAECARPARLVPDYDEQFLAWLFRELAVGGVRGEARFHLVRNRGAVVGWYVYYLDPGGLCRVLQVMTRERHSDLVVGELYRDAYAGGAVGALRPARAAHLRGGPRAGARSCDRFRVRSCTRAAATPPTRSAGRSALSWLDGEPW